MRSFIYGMICICISAHVSRSQNISKGNHQVPRVSIRVVDKETLQPVDARILIIHQHVDHAITPLLEDKTYRYKLAVTDTVNISIYADGYHLLNESLIIGELNGVETYYLTAKPSSASALSTTVSRSILKDDISTIIYFSQSNTEIAPRSSKHLERIGDYLRKNQIDLIHLNGHTDNVGDPDKNMKLSMERNSVVRAYLLRSTDLAGSIASKAYGGTKPAAPNDCEHNKKFNRRVEVRLSPASPLNK